MGTGELYHDQKTIMHGDIEMPLSIKPRLRDLPPITADEIVAYTKPATPPAPRPTVTAYQGADIDAYWLDGETWTHCITGVIWRPTEE